MPQSKELIPYNFGFGGQQQRSDDRFAPLGRPKQLRNIRFPKQGRISRRGQFGTPTGTTGTAVILQKMFSVGEEGLLAYGVTSTGVRGWYTYEPTSGTMISAGGAAVPRAWVKHAPEAHTIAASVLMTVADVAHGTSQACYVALQNASIEYWIVDEKTNRVLASGNSSTVGSNGTSVENVRVIAIPGTNTFVVGACRGALNDIRLFKIDTTGILTQGVVNTVNTSNRWDWSITAADALYIAFHSSSTATNVELRKYNTASFTNSATTITLGVAPLAVAVVVPYSTSSTRITVLAHEGTNGLRGVSYNSSLVATQALWVVQSTTTTVNCISAAERSDGTLEVYDEQNNASAYNIVVRRHQVTVGSAASSTDTIYNARLASKPVVTSSYYAFVCLGYHSNDSLQHSLFLYEGASIVGRFMTGTWITRSLNTVLPNMVNYKDNGSTTTKFYSACLQLSRLYATQSGTTREPAIAGVWFDTDAASGFVGVDDEDTKLITGGYLSLFDGANVVDNGFLLAPEIVSATGAAGGSMTASGSYLFKAVYVWTDARGRVHRSAASQAFTGTTGVGQGTVNVVVRGMPHTRHTLVNVELYRTTNGGTSYRLAAVTQLSTSASTTTISSTGSDATLTSSTPIYQQGNILGNDQPSCPVAIASTGRRILVTPGDDMLAVTQGKSRVEKEGAAFFDGVERRITLGGDISALATVGDRWLAFKKRSIFVASGEGADDSGQGDSLSEFEQFASDVGCARPATIVQTTHGTIFLGEKGFYLLNMAGGLVYLGAGVEDDAETAATGAQITDAAYDKDAGTLHFQTIASECYVLTLFQTEDGYDWRWSVDDGVAFAGVAFTGGRLWASRSSSSTTPLQRYEPTGTYSSGTGQSFTLRVRTGWIPVAGLQQGRGRLYNALIVGNASATSTMDIGIAYDFVETFVQTDTADAALTGNSPAQWKFAPSKQRAQVVMFDFSQSASVGGADTELSQLLLTVGTQFGGARIPASRVAT